MLALDEFSQLVAGIYAAASAAERWESVLHRIRRIFDGTAGGLFMADGAVWSIQDATIPAAAAKSYAEYYCRLDHVLDAVAKGPVGALRTGTELMPLVRKSEFYEDWLRPLDIDDGLFVRLSGGPRPTCFVVAAPRRTESFETPERVKLMGSLVPHLQQALRTQNQLAAAIDRSADLWAALDVIRHGVIIVGSQGHVLELNSAAEAILRAQDGLLYKSGRIIAGTSGAQRELQCALRDALTDDGSDVRRGHTFTCPRPSAKRSCVIHVLPVHDGLTEATSRGPAAMMLIVDPEGESESVPTTLQRLYSFTASEAQVALRVAQGRSLKQIAEELSVSYQTVRTHLQHVFDKTDTHRQGELIRLLLALNP